MMSKKDLELWLKFTGADNEINLGDKPDLHLLQKLVKYQLKEAFYQNYDLLVTRKQMDLSPTALVNRILVEGRRGMCFESCELMALVLEGFNFDARRVPTFCTVNGQEYEEGAIFDHMVIVVYLDGKKYLVDIIFSFNSIREPIEFSFEQTEERTIVQDVEKYRLEVNEDHCMMHMWLKGSWAKMYRIHLPLKHYDSQQLLNTYKLFLETPNTVMIRDKILKIGRMTETGRIGFTCNFESKQLRGSGPYTLVISENFSPAESKKISYEEFRDGIKEHFGIKINEEHFIN